ncbi:MAG: PA14 domain-containing protein [bacterium]|nr:PA14 domain-containing protein [bacterium]
MQKKILSALVILIVIFLFAAKPTKASPPTNFQTTTVVSTGLTGPSGFDIAPDGRIFILQRSGEIKIFKDGQLLSQNFAVLGSVTTGDRGLIGIAFDPDYFNNHWVYFYFTDATDLHNRLVRFNASGNVGTDGPVILFETDDPSEQLHVGGTIRFGPDGKLYLSVGDNGYFPNAQDLTNPHGKILRLNKDGTVPSDNPFVGQSGVSPEIWAYGLRNPFRFTFDTQTNNLFVGDVGEATIEEINKVIKGKNYGWPTCEGSCNPANSNFIDPIYTYPHNGGSAAVMVGPIYYGQMFPSSYNGTLFFSDYAKGFIKNMKLNSDGTMNSVSDFDLQAGSVVDMKIDPRDGSMFYLTFYPGALFHTIYSTGIKAPSAQSSADVTKGSAPLTVHFSSSGSSDPNNLALTYTWDFGDGTTSTSPNPVKTFQNGQFIVQLKVNNGTYYDLADPIVIQAGNPPNLTIVSPADGSNYKAGNTISYHVEGIDESGQNLPDSAFSTNVLFHHQTHIHPFSGPVIGKTGNISIPTTGESSPETWYEIDISAKNSNGLITTKTINIYPLKSNMTFSSNIPGLKILIDGIPTTTNQVIQGVVGFERELGIISTQTLNGTTYTFNHWSDNGFVKHFITTPSTDTTYTAYFDQANPFSGQYFKNANLQGSPELNRQDANINFDWGDGPPDPSFPSDNFSIRWTKTQYFSQGRYQFITSTDDGVRLFIDGNLVIDKWHDQGTTTYSFVQDLSTGNHTIKMEYYDSGGGAVAKLSWDITPLQPDQPPLTTPTPTPTTPAPVDGTYSGQYFDNRNLSGTPKLTRNDSFIQFNWDQGSPDPSILSDNFSVKWTRTVTLDSGTYHFTTTSDDGVRMYVDNQKIIDKWQDQGSTTYTADISLSQGSHTIIVEYYEAFGGAVIKFEYSQVSSSPTNTPTPTPTPTQPPAGNGYNGEYWNSGTGAIPEIPSSAPTLTRDDAEINFNWDQGSPNPLINNDHFIVRWTKTATLDAGTYRFTTTSDDGMRVFLDNQQILNDWSDHGTNTESVDTPVESGTHTIRVEYYENGGGAVAKFSYDLISPGGTPTSTPTPTPTPTPGGGQSSNLLSSAWHISGTSNTAAEAYQSVSQNILNGKSSLTLTYDIHGICLFNGDASAIIFDQNGWKMISLSKYGNNCYDGTQTISIPLSDFKDINSEEILNTASSLTGNLHGRFWTGTNFSVDISSISLH